MTADKKPSTKIQPVTRVCITNPAELADAFRGILPEPPAWPEYAEGVSPAEIIGELRRLLERLAEVLA